MIGLPEFTSNGLVRIESVIEHNGGMDWELILVYVRGKYFGRHRPAQHGLQARNFFASTGDLPSRKKAYRDDA
jgi:hypothetical protein